MIPSDPLERFCRVYDALNARRGLFQDAMPLRYSALTLATIEGEPPAIADGLYALADDLKARAGWFGSLNSPIRFLVAALLLKSGDRPAAFCAEVERVSAMFRDAGLRRGSIYEVIAVLILRQRDPDHNVDVATVARFQSVYEMMKSYHWWLTGPEDYAACALFASRSEPIADVGRRVERQYQALRETGFPVGDALQLVSHILALGPGKGSAASARFLALHEEFKRAGVAMWQTDYDELATLTFLDHEPREVVRRVVEHRRRMETLSPQPDRVMTFSLACGTAFLELARLTPDLREVTDAQALIQVQSIIAAQQAAAAATAASAASAAAASS